MRLANLVLLAASFASLRDGYVRRYFEMFPTSATQAGWHGEDSRLEDLSRPRLAAWLRFNRKTLSQVQSLAADPALSDDDRLDAEALSREIARQIHDFAVRKRPQRDPLFWTEVVANSTPFLLIRESRPRALRLKCVRSRLRAFGRLARQAEEALSATDPSLQSRELFEIAADQARASAEFCRAGLPEYSGNDALLHGDALRAARSLDALAGFLAKRAASATGSPRLGSDYAETFRLATSIEADPSTVLAEAQRDLVSKRTEAAAFARSIWKEIFPEAAAPQDDRELLRQMFALAAQDHASSNEEFILDYKTQVGALDAFLRRKSIVTLPDPLTLVTAPSPAFFVGQSVGGLYAAGPFDPGEQTLWFLPMPSADAPAERREAFFRDFNHHFNVMITPHETLPGHYLQLKYAARHPRKVRTLFPDGVFVEGWGTFCERLLLDEGWGGPLDRIAHLKKQMENIARTIADIRVHSTGMTREELVRFVKEEALQDDQFASNMWTRSITSAPQLTFYYLGYRQVRGLYDEVRQRRGESFRLKVFMDEMMRMGPVPVERYRKAMLEP